MASSAATRAAAAVRVKPILSRDVDEARRRVMELYRAWYREVPNTGSAMIIGGAVELNAADQAVRVAEDEVGKSETELEKYKQKVSEYESEISQTERNISQKDQQLRQTHKEIQQVKQQMEAVGEFQRKLRSAVNLLGFLSGKVRVVEHQTRRFSLQEPVMKVMEDVMNAMKKITGNELLYSEDMSRLIQKIKENDRRLKAVCVSENNAGGGY